MSRARGGFGLVMTCASHVTREGQGWQGELGIFDDSLYPGLRTLASALHREGASPFVQIFHGGMRADAAASGLEPLSADAGDGYRAASDDDIARIIVAFGDAAQRAESAGFDGVEIHGAHGYLLTQFLSRTQNTRVDRWGGALEGRARLVRAVTREVRTRTSPRFTVGVRISPEDFGNAQGLDLDESVTVAGWLAEDGVDFVHLSLWKALVNTKKRPDVHAVDLFRAALPPDVRIFVAGTIWTGAEAQSLLDRGADAVALARAAIVNPSWPKDVRDASWVPKRPPVTVAELAERHLSPAFAEYMRGWKGFVEG